VDVAPSSHRPAIRILELGSGSGWLGLNLASLYPSACITMSDLPEVLPVLQAQIDRVALFAERRWPSTGKR